MRPGPLATPAIPQQLSTTPPAAPARFVADQSRWLRLISICIVFLAAVVALQLAAGAARYVPTDPDEPAHFVSGLAVRDYLASGLRTPPLEYGRNYYAHYPKLAIGNWPPVFYVLQGVWLLIFPVDPRSILALMTLLGTATAVIVQRALSRELAAGYGWLGGGVLLTLPPLAIYASSVMAELPLMFITTLALWSWARYLGSRKHLYALCFAAASAVAVLTKGNALYLLLLPVLTVLLWRQWWVLRSRLLWGAAVGFAAVAGPWTWGHLDTVRAGWASSSFVGEYVIEAAGYYLGYLASALGPVVAILVCGGACRAWKRPISAAPIFACSAALIVAVILFHAFVPSGATRRHLIVAYPAVAILAGLGAHEAVRALSRFGVRPRAAALGVGFAIVIVLIVRPHRLPERKLQAFAHAAALVSAGSDHSAGVVSLIVSDALGEGIYIQQIALRDTRRPRDVVWRGSKLLASATWGGTDYRLRAESSGELITLLDEAGIRSLVLDRTAPSQHAALLARTIEALPEQFVLRARLPLVRDGVPVPDGLEIYSYRAAEPGATPPIRLRQVPGYEGVEARPAHGG